MALRFINCVDPQDSLSNNYILLYRWICTIPSNLSSIWILLKRQNKTTAHNDTKCIWLSATRKSVWIMNTEWMQNKVTSFSQVLRVRYRGMVRVFSPIYMYLCTLPYNVFLNTGLDQERIIGTAHKKGRSGNRPHIWLNSQDSELLDVLLKIEPVVGIYHTYAYVQPPATWTSPRLARSDCCLANMWGDCLGVSGLESILFAPRSSWTGPGDSWIYVSVCYIRQQPALFSVTHPVTLNFANSIKCVGDSRSYPSYACSLLCAPG